jgi:AmmeMemoRadiSam system protein B
MPIIYGAIMPHPPIIVSEVGEGREDESLTTVQSCVAVAFELSKLNPDTVIVFTPHGEAGSHTVHVYSEPEFSGHFGNFGIPKPVFKFEGDHKLAVEIVKQAKEDGVPAAEIDEVFLDHGALVPLSFIAKSKLKAKILPIAIAMRPLPALFKFGKALQKACQASDKKIAVIASADLSHCLIEGAPAGFDERGREFDEKLVGLVEDYEVNKILNFDENLAQAAAQDALWSIAMLLGALDGLNFEHTLLSYEGPFGVGYMVAKFKISSF